jgi:hypothetical protein
VCDGAIPLLLAAAAYAAACLLLCCFTFHFHQKFHAASGRCTHDLGSKTVVKYLEI